MDFMNTPEQFAHIPKDILRDRRMTLAAKGLYSVICTFGPDSPVSITAVAELLGLPVEEIDPIWDEMVSFMRLKEKEEELFRAMAEMQQELGGAQNGHPENTGRQAVSATGTACFYFIKIPCISRAPMLYWECT